LSVIIKITNDQSRESKITIKSKNKKVE